MKKARQEGLARFSFGRWAGLQNRVIPGIQGKIWAFVSFKLNTGNAGDRFKIAQFLREEKKKVHFFAKKSLRSLHMCSRITLFPEGREQKNKTQH